MRRAAAAMSRHALLLSLVANLLGTPASARETGMAAPDNGGVSQRANSTNTRTLTDAFGACLVNHNAARIGKLIDLPVGRRDYAKLYESIFYDSQMCVTEQTLRISELAARGAIFQALVLREYGADQTALFPAEIQTGYRASYATPLSDKAQMYLALEMFGECVSRMDAVGVRTLLRSGPNSPEENAAITALMPRLSACTVKGNRIRTSRSSLRGALAEGLYRLSRAAVLKGAN